jgi:riboflavin synthase
MLVPHTLGRTTLGDLAIGSTVNVEIDVLARYVARQLELGGPEKHDAPSDERLLDKLRAGGFL